MKALVVNCLSLTVLAGASVSLLAHPALSATMERGQVSESSTPGCNMSPYGGNSVNQTILEDNSGSDLVIYFPFATGTPSSSSKLLRTYEVQRAPAIVLPRLNPILEKKLIGKLVVIHRDGWQPIFGNVAGFGDHGFQFSNEVVRRLTESGGEHPYNARILVMAGVTPGRLSSSRLVTPEASTAYARWGGRSREQACHDQSISFGP